MKVLVTYMSLSGNTKKIAEAIFQEIQEEKEIKEITPDTAPTEKQVLRPMANRMPHG